MCRGLSTTSAFRGRFLTSAKYTKFLFRVPCKSARTHARARAHTHTHTHTNTEREREREEREREREREKETHTHTHTHTRTHTHTHTRTHSHTHTHTRTHTHTNLSIIPRTTVKGSRQRLPWDNIYIQVSNMRRGTKLALEPTAKKNTVGKKHIRTSPPSQMRRLRVSSSASSHSSFCSAWSSGP